MFGFLKIGKHGGVEPDGRVVSSGAEGLNDDAKLEGFATALADGIESALSGWVTRSVERVMMEWKGNVPPEVRAAAEVAGEAARNEIAPVVRLLLCSDIDAQRRNPLDVVRDAVRYPTDVLCRAGAPPVRRDANSQARFPDDTYDLAIATFSDLDPTLHERGLMWGAAKAHVHLRRRQAEGSR